MCPLSVKFRAVNRVRYRNKNMACCTMTAAGSKASTHPVRASMDDLGDGQQPWSGGGDELR